MEYQFRRELKAGRRAIDPMLWDNEVQRAFERPPICCDGVSVRIGDYSIRGASAPSIGEAEAACNPPAGDVATGQTDVQASQRRFPRKPWSSRTQKENCGE